MQDETRKIYEARRRIRMMLNDLAAIVGLESGYNSLSAILSAYAASLVTFGNRLNSDETFLSSLSSSITSLFTRLTTLENKINFTISKAVTLPVLAANAPLDVKVSFPSPMPNTDYLVTAIPLNMSSLLLGKISVVNPEQIKNVGDVTVRIKSSIAISLTTESITLLIVARSN